MFVNFCTRQYWCYVNLSMRQWGSPSVIIQCLNHKANQRFIAQVLNHIFISQAQKLTNTMNGLITRWLQLHVCLQRCACSSMASLLQNIIVNVIQSCSFSGSAVGNPSDILTSLSPSTLANIANYVAYPRSILGRQRALKKSLKHICAKEIVLLS